MEQRTKAVYAVPCVPRTKSGIDTPEDFFFLTFKTTNEREALILASCVCGKSKAERVLILLDENGDIW